jgi:ankyrin repeat protein
MPQPSFRALIEEILADDVRAVMARLDEAPSLVAHASTEGASRADAARFFMNPVQAHLMLGDTALHVAAVGYRVAVVRLLLDRGSDCRRANRLGGQPLHSATSGGPTFAHYDGEAQGRTIEALIRAGADPNATTKAGAGALHAATRNRSAPAVEALLLGGANPRARNKSGSMPLHLAVQTTGRGGTGADIARQHQRRIIELLLEHGARATDRDGSGRTVRAIARGTPLEELCT